MSGSIRVADLPDLGTVTDAASFVADRAAATGRLSALALKAYCTTTTLPDAPSNNLPYGRMNGAWTPVVVDAPSNNLYYARINATWGPVPPEAPLTGSTYGRLNGAWTPVMPISGGTISGNFGATGNITAGGGVYGNALSVSSSAGYEWQRYIQDGTGNHIDQHRTGWYDQWASATGTRTWVGPSGGLMSLDSAGNLGALGSVTSAAIWVASSSFGFTGSPTTRAFYFQPTYMWTFDTTSHILAWNNNGTGFWFMRPSDNLCYNQLGPVGGNGPYVTVSDRRAKENIAPSTRGLAEIMQLQPVSFTRGDPSTGAAEEIGFIAQDVAPIIPEATWVAGITLRDGSGALDSGDPSMGLSPETITAVNVKAIQELNGLLTALNARVAALEAP